MLDCLRARAEGGIGTDGDRSGTRDCPEAQGQQGGGQVLFRRWVVERTFSSTVSVSSLVEGLREEPGEFPGLVTLGGMSFPDASNGP
ncbi:MAG: hypothetical protein OXD45_12340 [Rhodobacteraceae bacterium]|nr:hypothetical protein [Paracoccaceae bacterium]